MRYLQLTLTAALLALSCSSYAADYYRWTDSKGMTHFSDKPPQGVKAEKIRTGSKRAPSANDPEPVPPDRDTFAASWIVRSPLHPPAARARPSPP